MNESELLFFNGHKPITYVRTHGLAHERVCIFAVSNNSHPNDFVRPQNNHLRTYVRKYVSTYVRTYVSDS